MREMKLIKEVFLFFWDSDPWKLGKMQLLFKEVERTIRVIFTTTVSVLESLDFS